MAIRFSCSACGKRLAVKDDNAGRRSKCPGCGGEILIPAPAEIAVVAHEPPPVPSLSIGEDWKRRPDEGEPLEIPGLQASPDDDAEDDDSGPVSVAETTSPAHPTAATAKLPPGRMFSRDPWYYSALDCLGVLICTLGMFFFAIFAFGFLSYMAGADRYSDVPSSSFMGSMLTLPAGAAILLIVDVARNIRRLRLHADRNAGIR